MKLLDYYLERPGCTLKLKEAAGAVLVAITHGWAFLHAVTPDLDGLLQVLVLEHKPPAVIFSFGRVTAPALQVVVERARAPQNDCVLNQIGSLLMEGHVLQVGIGSARARQWAFGTLGKLDPLELAQVAAGGEIPRTIRQEKVFAARFAGAVPSVRFWREQIAENLFSAEVVERFIVVAGLRIDLPEIKENGATPQDAALAANEAVQRIVAERMTEISGESWGEEAVEQ